MRSSLRSMVLFTGLMVFCLSVAATPAAAGKAAAMIIEFEGAGRINSEGSYREAGIASDLYTDETLIVDDGTATLIVLDTMETFDVTAPGEVLVTPAGLQPIGSTAIHIRGQESLMVAGADLSDFSQAIGTAGVLRDTGNRAGVIKSQKQESKKTMGGLMDIEEAPRAEREESSSRGSLSPRRKPAPSAELRSDEMQPPREPEKKELPTPAVWAGNSFYHPDFVVLACDAIPGAQRYEFTVRYKGKEKGPRKSLTPYIEVSKDEWQLWSGKPYSLLVRIYGADETAIGSASVKFTVLDTEALNKLALFFQRPPAVRGMLLEKLGMTREAIYLYKTTIHLHPGLAGGLSKRIRDLQTKLGKR